MIKSIIRFIFRPLFAQLPLHLQIRIRSAFNRNLKQERANRQLAQLLLHYTSQQVASGPFEGMKYVHTSANSAYCPKILGTYEKELQPAINEITHKKYTQVIDIGAAEGYYAVGIALQLPNIPIIAYESDLGHHRLLRQLSRLNSVGHQITLRGQCTPQDLNLILEKALTLIICDVEGAEMELMDPDTIPLLKYCDILVETHDFARPGVTEFLRKAFNTTHTITTFVAHDRIPTDWPYKEHLPIPAQKRLEMLDEGRNGVKQEWLWMETHAEIPH